MILSVNISFGECLSSVLQTLNLKPSKLAKEMNIDSSLIYKWLRNERVPSYETQYIDQISGYVAKRINNTYQKEELLNLFIKYGIKLSDTSGAAISDLLKKMLYEAQGYSIRQHRAIKHSAGKVSELANTLNSIDIRKRTPQIGGGDINECPEMLFSCSDYIQIIKGRNGITSAETELLKKAARIKPSSGENTILITYNSEIDVIDNDKWRNNWINILSNVMSNGWRIVLQIILGNNIRSKMIIIEALQILLAYENINIYYQKTPCYINSFYKEYIVPGIGALICFPPVCDPEMNRAFWYQSRESIITLTEHFAVRLNTAKPLIKPYPPQKSTEFQQAFAEAEEMFGDKFVLKDGLSAVTMPAGLYEKYLRESGRTSHEISYRLFLHKRRLDSFNTQIKYYRYKDICFSESLEKLVNGHGYSFDENNVLGGRIPDTSDIRSHLYNVIEMLQKYDNYKLAIISKKQFRHFVDINWAVKDKCCVLFGSDGIVSAKSFFRSEINFTVTEEDVVMAFAGYFRMIWDQIPESCKDKAETIKQLEGYIKRIQQHGTDCRIANA